METERGVGEWRIGNRSDHHSPKLTFSVDIYPSRVVEKRPVEAVVGGGGCRSDERVRKCGGGAITRQR